METLRRVVHDSSHGHFFRLAIHDEMTKHMSSVAGSITVLAQEEAANVTKTILVVDDCDAWRWCMSIVLTGAGYEVIEACDGKDALFKLDEWRIDLVVSDLNMPKMDGTSLINAMKRLRAHEAIPVIILSSDISKEKMERALSAGAVAWMSKPLRSEQLLASISQLVNT